MTSDQAMRLHERIDKVFEQLAELTAELRESNALHTACRGIVLGDVVHEPVDRRLAKLEQRQAPPPAGGEGDDRGFLRRHLLHATVAVVGGLLYAIGEWTWEPVRRLIGKLLHG